MFPIIKMHILLLSTIVPDETPPFSFEFMEEFMNIVHTLQLLDCACHTQGCKDQFTTMFYWPIINFINGKISEESANTSCVKE